MSESDLVQKGKQIDRKQIDQAVDESIQLNVAQGCAAFLNITAAPTKEAFSGGTGLIIEGSCHKWNPIYL